MLSKSIKTAIAIFLVSVFCFGFSNVDSGNSANKARWCALIVHVYAYGSGCSSPQAGVWVLVTYYDGRQDKELTDSNGDAHFNCWGPTVDATVNYNGHRGHLCTTTYTDGVPVYLCINDVSC